MVGCAIVPRINHTRNNYELFYDLLEVYDGPHCQINTRKDLDVMHHIQPRCMGGTDDESNLVKLSTREHFVAHRLLAKIYSTHAGLTYAYEKMKHDNDASNSHSFAAGIEEAYYLRKMELANAKRLNPGAKARRAAKMAVHQAGVNTRDGINKLIGAIQK